MITLLSGGTGGAKLARGMLDVVGPDQLAVVANTGDDIAAFGLHVSPDPDLITYWLADVIDERRGWGVQGETQHTFEQLVSLGAPDWFTIGDKDLATCMLRTQLLHEGRRLTEITRLIAQAFGLEAYVLPMCDEPVQTQVRTEGEWHHFQEYLILQHGEPELEDVNFRGVESARVTEEVKRAIEIADALVIGPSNPIASIGPVLAVPGMREALERADAPIVAVSPLVDGRSIKGPTERFMGWAGLELSDSGIATHYAGLIQGMVTDRSSSSGTPTLSEVVVRQTNTIMATPGERARVAQETLDFAASLAE